MPCREPISHGEPIHCFSRRPQSLAERYAGAGSAQLSMAPRAYRRDTWPASPICQGLATDDMAALRDAALAGVGVVQLPTMTIWRQVESGELIHVLPDRAGPARVSSTPSSSARNSTSVRTLLDFLVTECAEARRKRPYDKRSRSPAYLRRWFEVFAGVEEEHLLPALDRWCHRSARNRKQATLA